MGAETTETTPAVWSEAGENLSRYAANARLETLADKEAQKKLALQYRLMSEYTSFFMVHERAEKADKLPALERVPQALARDWAGERAFYHDMVVMNCAPESPHSAEFADSPAKFSPARERTRQLEYKACLTLQSPERLSRSLKPFYQNSDSDSAVAIESVSGDWPPAGDGELAGFPWDNPGNDDIRARGWKIDELLNSRASFLSSRFNSPALSAERPAIPAPARQREIPENLRELARIVLALESALGKAKREVAAAALAGVGRERLNALFALFRGGTGSWDKESAVSFAFLFLLEKLGEFYAPETLSFLKAKIFLASVPLEQGREWDKFVLEAFGDLIP
jgi:hypothetical protein